MKKLTEVESGVTSSDGAVVDRVTLEQLRVGKGEDLIAQYHFAVKAKLGSLEFNRGSLGVAHQQAAFHACNSIFGNKLQELEDLLTGQSGKLRIGSRLPRQYVLPADYAFDRVYQVPDVHLLGYVAKGETLNTSLALFRVYETEMSRLRSMEAGRLVVSGWTRRTVNIAGAVHTRMQDAARELQTNFVRTLGFDCTVVRMSLLEFAQGCKNEEAEAVLLKHGANRDFDPRTIAVVHYRH